MTCAICHLPGDGLVLNGRTPMHILCWLRSLADYLGRTGPGPRKCS